MFKKLYQHLLTHYPLLWNTRVVWVIAVSLIIHLFFFLGGFVEVSVNSLKNYYNLGSVLTPGLYTFSILCSLAVIIMWLVFYLRNNAFKSFYIIGKYHSLKEFCIILLVIFFCITFFESFRYGAWLKTRTITGKEQLVKEANTINLARAFIPQSKEEYFILNTCGNRNGASVVYNEGFNYFDTSNYAYNDTNSIKVRAALNEPGAFSYRNYCKTFIELNEYKNFVPDSQWIATKNRWIESREMDSIKYILDECLAVSKKYGVDQKINTGLLARLVFSDSFNNVTRIIANSYSVYDSVDKNVDYFDEYSLNRALELIDECYLNSTGYDNHMDTIVVEIYTALCFAILLFCYRLYNKKVFLISVVGTIVWAILFALFGIFSSGGDGFAWFYLFLFALFITLALISLNGSNNKTATGVLLNWHVYMTPFFLMLIIFLINDNYDRHVYYHLRFLPLSDTQLQEKYPFGYWISNHMRLLFRLNLLLVFLYIAFFFTHLSKKWHISPEE